jgi:hypothetical protein
MRRPWPGDIVWYRMWAIAVLAFAVLLTVADWLEAIVLSGCVMGAYGIVVSLVYEGEWTRDAEGDKVWLPTESPSSEPPGPPDTTEKRGSIWASMLDVLFPVIVIALLAYAVRA